MSKAKIKKNEYIKKQINRFSSKREKLKIKMKDKSISQDEKYKISNILDSLPKNSSPSRYRNRCSITGKPRSYNRYTSLCRNAFREYVSFGKLAGFIKSS